MNSTLGEISHALGIATQLLLIKRGALLEQRGRISYSMILCAQIGEALTVGEIAG
jgi:hypothetical protein